MLKINDLCVNYGMLEAVKDVSMEVPEGKVVSLLGANGSGKSTILKTVSGLKAPREGEILFEDTKVDGMEIDAIVELGISQVPEGRRLFPYMTVLENLNLGAYVRSSKAEVNKVREEVFERFPVLKRRSRVRAHSMSGGEQELLSVARALMSRPRMLLMDEPCQGLSPIMGQGDRQDDPVTERERDHHSARRAQRIDCARGGRSRLHPSQRKHRVRRQPRRVLRRRVHEADLPRGIAEGAVPAHESDRGSPGAETNRSASSTGYYDGYRFLPLNVFCGQQLPVAYL